MPPPAPPPSPHLTTPNFWVEAERLFNNALHADIILRSDNVQFFAHKALLAIRTPYFDDATSGFVDRVNGKPVFAFNTSISTPAVWRFLRWVYTGAYEWVLNQKDFRATILDDGRFGKHLNVYLLAQTLALPSLQSLATTYLKSELYDCSIADFCLAVRAVYARTKTGPQDKALRQMVCKAAASDLDALLQDRGFLRIMRELTAFAVELVRCLAAERNALMGGKLSRDYEVGSQEGTCEYGDEEFENEECEDEELDVGSGCSTELNAYTRSAIPRRPRDGRE